MGDVFETGRGVAFRGTVFTVLSYGLSQLIRLISSLLLARMLLPDAFGLIALVNAFMQGMEMLTDFGVGANIVQSRSGLDRMFLQTAWTLQVLRSIVLWCGCAVLAAPVAAFFASHDPRSAELATILPVAAISVVIAGFNSTSVAVLSKRLQFGGVFAVQLVPQIICLLVTVEWAKYRSPSAWAVVAGGLAASVVRCGVSHALNPVQADSFGWSRAAFKQLWGFGAWTMCSSAVAFLSQQGDKMVLARVMSLEELGLYSLAIVFARVGMNVVSRVSNGVVFPILSGAQGEPDRLMEIAFNCRAVLLRVAGVFCIGFAMLAPVFFKALYDLRFEPAGSMSQWLGVYVWVWILSASVDRIPLALGYARPLLPSGLVAALSPWCGYVGFKMFGFGGFVSAMSLCMFASHVVLLRSIPALQRELFWQGVRASLPVLLYGLVAICLCVQMENRISQTGAAMMRMVAAVIPCLWILPEMLRLAGWRRRENELGEFVERISSGKQPVEVLKERRGDVLVVRSSGPDGKDLVVKLWNRRGPRGWLRRVTRTSSAWREYVALLRLRNKASVPEVLGYFRLRHWRAAYTEAVVLEDFGRCGDLTEHVKRLRRQGGDAALAWIEEELIKSTQTLVESNIVDVDHRLPNFLVRPCGVIARVDFEMAHRVRNRGADPAELGGMLGTLIGSYAFALQPDTAPVGVFAESLARVSKACPQARRFARLQIDKMLCRQHREAGIRTAVALDW
jgi:O-antigen/teichoic acid export membrane protein